VLALEGLAVDQLAARALNYLDATVLAPLQKKGLDYSGLSGELGSRGVAALGILMTNPPIGHLLESLCRER
jgi:hypothetical protein